MLNEEEIKQRHTAMIKASYLENFQREILPEELEEVFLHLLPRMEKDLKELKNYTPAEFNRYMSSTANQLLFSPRNIYGEINRVISSEGIDQFSTAGKYKRLREMEIATRFCFANYKRTGEMLMVQPQDNPDIILAVMGEASEDKQIRTSRLEIMVIPEIAKGKLQGDLSTSLANFVQEKKFLKDYGGICSLLVCLDFTQQGLDIDKIAEVLRSATPNPYHSIWVTFTSSEDGKTISVFQIYPGVIRQDYNLHEEPNLLY